MSNLDNAIELLKESRYYKDLWDYKPPFNPFEVMSVPYRELTHSSVLAWLLMDRTNKKFRQNFVAWVANQENGLDEKAKDKLKFYYAEDDDIEVRCEYGDSEHGRIDVFARFPDLKLAIAIEVKIWAGEQYRQIDRYQGFLKKKYPRHTKMVIFLTPWGYKPASDVEKFDDVPVLIMSWGTIAEIIDKVNNTSDELVEKYIFRKQFSQHIKRNIIMEKDEKHLVRNLLSDPGHAETIQKIFNNMPSLYEYRDGWKEIVAKVCDTDKDSLIETTYPGKGQPFELKLAIPEWEKAGLPFQFMLYKYENAMVRIMVYKGHLEEGSQWKEKLDEFAENSNGIVKFTALNHWWCSVLSEYGGQIEREETLINIYSEDWAEQAEEKLSLQMANLLPLIQKWVSDHQ